MNKPQAFRGLFIDQIVTSDATITVLKGRKGMTRGGDLTFS